MATAFDNNEIEELKVFQITDTTRGFVRVMVL